MKKTILSTLCFLLVSCFMFFADAGTRIVVLGSSTAAGATGHRTKCIWVEIEKKEKRFVGQRVVYDDGIKAHKTKRLRRFT